ncbi:isochorismate synthase [Corticibacter populi]|nr:isochorismate synthase [Corticibacter populi]RZS35767.1 isochorismate synthase [Corticibacter populi]
MHQALDRPPQANATPAAQMADWPAQAFVLHGPNERLATAGLAQVLYEGSTIDLADRSGQLLDALRAQPQAPALLVGGLPFDRAKPCHLFQPQRRLPPTGWRPTAAKAEPALSWRIEAQPTRTRYARMVREAAEVLRHPDHRALRKIVLARSLLTQASGPISAARLLERLTGDQAVTGYALPLPAPQAGSISSAGTAAPYLVGATPELLLTRRGPVIASQPLAGSSRRLPNQVADAEAREHLQQSAKDVREHRVVVETIADMLAPCCRNLQVPKVPAIHATASMWHLGTRIEGQLKHPEDLATTSSLALAARLQPTPALCGAPREEALQWIRQHETVPRGFFGGAVGWCDAEGDGSWYVAIRCAHIEGESARLFAGAGIMADSDPEQEAAETRAKFNAMIDALDLAAALQLLERQAPL